MQTENKDFSELLGEIRRHGTIKQYAKAIGRTEQTVNAKLRNKTDFTVGDIKRTVVYFGQPAASTLALFFPKELVNFTSLEDA